MRPEEHAQLSAIAAAAAYPWLKKDVWIPFTASLLIDADHYIWHAVTHRTLSLRAAARYFQQSNPPQLPDQRLLHQPMVLGLLLFLAVRLRSRLLGLILAGLVFHVGIDRFHNYQFSAIKREMNEDAHYSCPQCGAVMDKLELHTVRNPKLIFKKYQRQNFVVLCTACHVAAHAHAPKRPSLLGRVVRLIG